MVSPTCLHCGKHHLRYGRMGDKIRLSSPIPGRNAPPRGNPTPSMHSNKARTPRWPAQPVSSLGIAGHQGGHGHTAQDGEREIPGGAPRTGRPSYHMMLSPLPSLPLCSLHDCLSGIVATKINRFRHIGIRFPPGFANLDRLQGGKLDALRLQPIRQVFKQLGASSRGRSRQAEPALLSPLRPRRAPGLPG